MYKKVLIRPCDSVSVLAESLVSGETGRHNPMKFLITCREKSDSGPAECMDHVSELRPINECVDYVSESGSSECVDHVLKLGASQCLDKSGDQQVGGPSVQFRGQRLCVGVKGQRVRGPCVVVSDQRGSGPSGPRQGPTSVWTVCCIQRPARVWTEWTESGADECMDHVLESATSEGLDRVDRVRGRRVHGPCVGVSDQRGSGPSGPSQGPTSAWTMCCSQRPARVWTEWTESGADECVDRVL